MFVLIGFGFLSIGMQVQIRYDSKVIGHLAATEVFKAAEKDSDTIDEIKLKFERLARSLGIRGLDIEIRQHRTGITAVRTNVSVARNSSLPAAYVIGDTLTTETYVYATLQ